jgi:hypothetical protein
MCIYCHLKHLNNLILVVFLFIITPNNLKTQHLPFNDVIKKNVKYLNIILILGIMLMINHIIYIPNYQTTPKTIQ